MKKSLTPLILAAAIFAVSTIVTPAAPAFAGEEAGHNHANESKAAQGRTAHKKYYCTMDPQVVSDKPGKCHICGMNLVEMKDSAAADDKKKVQQPN